MSRRGFILPLVLLATLAITALAVAAFTLAQAEHRATEWERSWVGAVAGADGAPPVGPLASLGSGYQLVAVGDPGASPLLRHEVWWCLDPRTEASGPWTPGDHPPRLGPLDPGHLLDLVGVEEITEAGTEILLLPAGGAPGDSLRLDALDAGRVAVLGGGGAGAVLVVAEGSLRLTGSGTLAGILLVGGQLDLEGGVEILGGARAATLVAPAAPSLAGEFSVDPGFPSRVTALSSLPACPVMVHTVGRLGYF